MTIADVDGRSRANGAGPTLPSAAAPASVMDALDARVREVVRAEAIDPQRDVAVVRRIAENVAREHDDRSLTGAVAKLGDVPAVVAELVARISGFGPLQPFLDDPTVEEIWINASVNPEGAGHRPTCGPQSATSPHQ